MTNTPRQQEMWSFFGKRRSRQTLLDHRKPQRSLLLTTKHRPQGKDVEEKL